MADVGNCFFRSLALLLGLEGDESQHTALRKRPVGRVCEKCCHFFEFVERKNFSHCLPFQFSYWNLDMLYTSNIIKILKIVFWGVIPCNLVDIYRRFGGTYCLHLQGRKQAEHGESVRLLGEGVPIPRSLAKQQE
jgi:hypothetical protein